MGFTSVLVFNNDYLHQHHELPFKEVYYGAQSQYYPLKQPLQGVEKPWEQHADEYCLMLVGGYTAQVLTTVHCNRHGPVEKDQAEKTLLKQLAEKHGFNLHRKSKKK